MLRPPPNSTLFPYTTLFRSRPRRILLRWEGAVRVARQGPAVPRPLSTVAARRVARVERRRIALRCRKTALTSGARSEEHTSELQSHSDLVCRLLLEKKKEKR